MQSILNLGMRFFNKPQAIRNLFFVGSSCVTLGVLRQPTVNLIDNLNSVTPTKVNLTVGIAILLLTSNSIFVYQYYRWFVNSKDNDEQEELNTP